VRSGQHSPKHWSNTQRPVDIYDVKNDAILILTSLGVNASSLQIQRNAPNYYHPGRSGSLILGKTILGYFGEIHPEILREMGVKDYIVGFEIMMDDVPQKPNKGTARPNLSLSAFQPVWRDFAFIVARDVQAESLIKAVRGADRKLIDYVDIFDIYQGDHIDADKKSVAISVMLQPVQETLNDAQLDAISNAIIQAVEKQTGGCLRA
jgi:phenylalanyl-tRNA synthetase beta chain